MAFEASVLLLVLLLLHDCPCDCSLTDAQALAQLVAGASGLIRYMSRPHLSI